MREREKIDERETAIENGRDQDGEKDREEETKREKK